MHRDVKAFRSWEVVNISRMYRNRTTIVLKEQTFLDVTRSIRNKSIEFGAQYVANLFQSLAKHVV